MNGTNGKRGVVVELEPRDHDEMLRLAAQDKVRGQDFIRRLILDEVRAPEVLPPAPLPIETCEPVLTEIDAAPECDWELILSTKLTPKEHGVNITIGKLRIALGRYPTPAEIAKSRGYKATHVAVRMLSMLEKKGRVVRLGESFHDGYVRFTRADAQEVKRTAVETAKAKPPVPVPVPAPAPPAPPAPTVGLDPTRLEEIVATAVRDELIKLMTPQNGTSEPGWFVRHFGLGR